MMVKSWTWLMVAGIVFLLLLPGLVWGVASLVRGNAGDLVASVALAPEQEITLPAVGEAVVLVEAPRMSTDYGDLQIELTEKGSGQGVMLKYSYVAAQGMVHGMSSIKVPFGRMTVERAGAYTVRVSGLAVGKDYSEYRVLISRPYLARMAVQIVGIVFCGVGMLGCVIWGVWLMGLMKQRG